MNRHKARAANSRGALLLAVGTTVWLQFTVSSNVLGLVLDLSNKVYLAAQQVGPIEHRGVPPYGTGCGPVWE